VQYLSIPVILQALLIIHVVRTRRESYWIYILIFVPIAGGIAYVAIELLPDLIRGKGARNAAAAVANAVAPDRVLRELERQAEFSPTVATKKAVADEYVARQRYPEAIELYAECLTGPFAEDSEVLMALAVAHHQAGNYAQAGEVLARVENAAEGSIPPEVLLVRARIREKQDDSEGAAAAYREAAESGSGLEYQYWYSSYLLRANRSAEAYDLYQAMVNRYRMMPGFSRKLNREWMRRADREMKGL
jgi:hypothetical protein